MIVGRDMLLSIRSGIPIVMTLLSSGFSSSRKTATPICIVKRPSKALLIDAHVIGVPDDGAICPHCAIRHARPLGEGLALERRGLGETTPGSGHFHPTPEEMLFGEWMEF